MSPAPRIATSPVRARLDVAAVRSTIRISAPAGIPTDPSYRAAGGSGLEAIWWVASVMP